MRILFYDNLLGFCLAVGVGLADDVDAVLRSSELLSVEREVLRRDELGVDRRVTDCGYGTILNNCGAQ